MINLKWLKILIKGTFIGIFMIGMVGCFESDKSVKLQGAGATFPYPLYSKMFDV